jgi:two-component system cell cycle response regulator
VADVRVVVAHSSAGPRRRISDALLAAGHDAIEASGAAEAFSLSREGRPDVLLADQALCERDGLPLLDLVKADLEIYRTAVVVIAPADLSPQAAEDLIRRGAQDLLIEPLRIAEAGARITAAGRTKILQEELVEQSRRLETQLFQDPLTRLYNRRFLFTQLGALASGARRHGRSLAVAMVDLDGFKSVNDEHGHGVGDAALVAAAAALQHSLRAEDVLGRLGGEEFLALLPDSDAVAAAAAAERLRAAVANAEGPVALTASVGWAVLAGDEEPDDLVRRADEALYAAKEAGRDRVRGPATLPRRT